MNNTPESFSKQEQIKAVPYREAIVSETEKSPIWELFDYDAEGFLRLKDSGYRVVELAHQYGDANDTPIQITDTLIVERRCREWKKMVEEVAREVGYPPENFEFHYATKANMDSPIVVAAMRVFDLETTSALDLENIRWLQAKNILPTDRKLKVICNGFKLGPGTVRRGSYAQRINELYKAGLDITWVLDAGELDFLEKTLALEEVSHPMEVGIRLKFGKVDNEDDLAKLVSRHGVSKEKFIELATRISRNPKLLLNTFHAMASAASEVEPEQFAKYHLFSAKIFFDMKSKFNSLTKLNIGGGIPPLGTGYDHQLFLRKYLAGVRQMAEAKGVPVPTIVFENGSLVATDAEHIVYRVDQVKSNSIDQLGQEENWLILKGSIMSQIPDLLILQAKFNLIAANNANHQANWGWVGDETCDSDGRLRQRVPFPIQTDGLYMVIPRTGAYQDLLAGKARNLVQHCGIMAPTPVVIWNDEKGRPFHTGGSRGSYREISANLAYGKKHTHNLRQTIR